MDNLKDAYIKEKLEKDKLISKKADDVFNNFSSSNIKIEKEKKKFNYKKLVAIAASVVIVFGAANVYASTQGYGNVFFMIKYLATGEKTTIKDKDELLSDRDITISYEPIKITVAQAQKVRLQKNNISYETLLKIIKNEKVKVEKFTGKIEKRAMKIYKDRFKNDKEFTDLIIKLLDEYFSSEAIS